MNIQDTLSYVHCGCGRDRNGQSWQLRFLTSDNSSAGRMYSEVCGDFMNSTGNTEYSVCRSGRELIESDQVYH